MAVVNVQKPEPSFKNTIVITDGAGSFVTETNADCAETKPYLSEEVKFIGTGDDKTGSLVTTASGTPPGVSGSDQGSGVLYLEGTPSDNIIPQLPVSVYEGGTVSTGGTPASYTLGDQVNIYKVFNVTVKSKHKSSAEVTIPCFVIKDWNLEKESLIQKINEEYPE